MEDSNKKALSDVEEARREKDELNLQIQKLQNGARIIMLWLQWVYNYRLVIADVEEMMNDSTNSNVEMEQLKKTLADERMKKIQVNVNLYSLDRTS
jgi:hypothetical protein